MSDTNNWADSAGLAWTVLTGLVMAIVGAFSVVLRASNRIKDMEARQDRLVIEITALVEKRIAEDRHNNINPMLQTRVMAPMDKLEEEVKTQGQNIAILMDRDHTRQIIQAAVDSVRPKSSV